MCHTASRQSHLLERLFLYTHQNRVYDLRQKDRKDEKGRRYLSALDAKRINEIRKHFSSGKTVGRFLDLLKLL